MRRREKSFIVRLTEKELDKLDRDVAKTGMSRESYVRALIAGNTPKELPPLEVFDVLRMLRQINNNINQIAAKANSIGFVDHGQYRKDSEAISEVMGMIIREVCK